MGSWSLRLGRASRLLQAALILGFPPCARTASSTAPDYSAAGIVNSATYSAGALAPNTIASIYGTNLSWDTAAVTSADLAQGALPTALAGVRVFVAGLEASLYYVSPQQINFLVRSDLRPGDMDLFVAREGTAGPHVQITVHDAGPGFYQWDPGMIAATHADGTVITKDHPAHPGEVVVLYGTGLGRTDPDPGNGVISMIPAQIEDLADLQVLVAGAVLDRGSVYYTGVTPGTPGLYQVNLKLPAHLTSDPEIQVVIGGAASPHNLRIPVR
ncbi:MAG TPA: hypothetical protein VLX58_18470 [Bryobacteraceae bacterium]|nr:hypothetical protein [Bryobacteraceae bacterium]